MIPTLDGQAVFRTTFLLNLAPPHAATLRAMGDMLETLFNNLENDAEEADLRLHEQALVTDLRYLAGYLGLLAKHTTATELPAEQFAIAERARALAPRLLRLIEDLGGSPARKMEPAPAKERLTIRTDFWVQIPMALAVHIGLEPEDEVEWEVLPEGLLLRRVEGDGGEER